MPCKLLTYTSENIENTPPLQLIDFFNVNTANFLSFLDNDKDLDYNVNLSIKDKLISKWKDLPIKVDKFWCSWTNANKKIN